MRNVEIKKEKKKMTLEIDLTKEFGKSKSGKTTIIASTDGNHLVDGIYIGLNIYRKNK